MVVVTDSSRDEGIGGIGILKVSLLMFPLFSKRNVRPSDTRDFRGAMSGHADKDLFLTTANLTSGATKKAIRDGQNLSNC